MYHELFLFLQIIITDLNALIFEGKWMLWDIAFLGLFADRKGYDWAFSPNTPAHTCTHVHTHTQAHSRNA